MAEFNLDNIATELNDKIGKGECVRYPVSKWLSSDGLSWYIVYNDGWKECGGHWARDNTTDGNVTLVLPIEFSNTDYAILKCNIHYYTDSITGRNFTFWNKTVNSVTTYQAKNGSYNTGFDYYACGY